MSVEEWRPCRRGAMLYSSMKCNGGYYEVHKVRVSSGAVDDVASGSTASAACRVFHCSADHHRAHRDPYAPGQVIIDAWRSSGGDLDDDQPITCEASGYGRDAAVASALSSSSSSDKQRIESSCFIGDDEKRSPVASSSSTSDTIFSDPLSESMSGCRSGLDDRRRRVRRRPSSQFVHEENEYEEDDDGAAGEESEGLPAVPSSMESASGRIRDTCQSDSDRSTSSSCGSTVFSWLWPRRSGAKGAIFPSLTLRKMAHLLIIILALGLQVEHLRASVIYMALLVSSLAAVYWVMLSMMVAEERVEIIKGTGVQISTLYRGGQMKREFVPLESILAVVINEAVTFNNCFFYLALLVRGEDDLVLLFEHLRPPLEVLISVRHSLVEALRVDGEE